MGMHPLTLAAGSPPATDADMAKSSLAQLGGAFLLDARYGHGFSSLHGLTETEFDSHLRALADILGVTVDDASDYLGMLFYAELSRTSNPDGTPRAIEHDLWHLWECGNAILMRNDLAPGCEPIGPRGQFVSRFLEHVDETCLAITAWLRLRRDGSHDLASVQLLVCGIAIGKLMLLQFIPDAERGKKAPVAGSKGGKKSAKPKKEKAQRDYVKIAAFVRAAVEGGKKKTEAVNDAADEFGVEDRTVWTALRKATEK